MENKQPGDELFDRLNVSTAPYHSCLGEMETSTKAVLRGVCHLLNKCRFVAFNSTLSDVRKSLEFLYCCVFSLPMKTFYFFFFFFLLMFLSRGRSQCLP